MKTNTSLLLAALAFCICVERSHAQGCSDAGVCTAGPIGKIANDSTVSVEARNYARLTFSYAIGERGTLITQA
ncbi:MAG TPA: hypothetical protein PK760_07665, partial [Flavobacteriales bacterium]|nr:hypothetical protein [Flavobacteriales bacterium]